MIRNSSNQKQHISNIIFIILIVILPKVLLGVKFSDLSFPLTKGDLLFNYQFQSVFWSPQHQISQHYGFPNGLDIRIWSGLDLLQTLIVGFFTLFTSNIFLAVNLSIYFSFIFSAFILWCLASSLDFSNFWKKFLVLAGISIPWFPGRIQHLDFLYIYITLIPWIVIFRTKIQKIRLTSVLTFGMLCGLGGPYIFIFSLIFIGLIVIYELLMNASSLKNLTPILILIPSAIFGFAMSYLVFTYGQSNTFPTLNRSLEESVHLAGYGFMLIMPLPWTRLPLASNTIGNYFHINSLTESTQFSNYGNAVLLFAVIVIAVLLILNSKRFSRDDELFVASPIRDKNLGVLFFLGLGLTLLFSKGGLGVFVSVIIPQIRAWNRLTPLIQVIILVVFITLVKNLQNISTKRYLKISFSILLVWNFWTISEGSFFQANRNEFIGAGKFVDSMHKEIPNKCGILQLPEASFPFAGSRYKMEDYDHFLLPLIDKQYEWSYGSAIQNPIVSIDDLSFAARISNFNYCGIVLDNYGYQNREVRNYLDGIYTRKSVSEDSRYIFYKIEKSD